MNLSSQWHFPTSTDDRIHPYLLNYKLLVQDLPALAGMWADMDDFERHHYQMMFMQTWGTRSTLGALYRDGRLTAEQETELAALDDELMRHLDAATLCYGLDLPNVAQLFTWGTPLARSDRVIPVPLRPCTLSEIAPALITLREKPPAW